MRAMLLADVPAQWHGVAAVIFFRLGAIDIRPDNEAQKARFPLAASGVTERRDELAMRGEVTAECVLKSVRNLHGGDKKAAGEQQSEAHAASLALRREMRTQMRAPAR